MSMFGVKKWSDNLFRIQHTLKNIRKLSCFCPLIGLKSCLFAAPLIAFNLLLSVCKVFASFYLTGRKLGTIAMASFNGDRGQYHALLFCRAPYANAINKDVLS